MHTPRPVVLAAIGTALLAAACGGDDTTTSAGGAGGETRTVEVKMVDIGFEPKALEVARGETVRFVFINTGAVAHDAFIGDEEAQAEHEEEMRAADGGEHGGGHGEDAEDAITVEPRDTGELTYTFGEAGTLEIGCHQQGHYDAGMKTTVEVA